MSEDRLEEMFERQRKFMDLLVQNDLMPEFPVDLTTKPGQRLVKENMFNMQEEMFEASYTLKNKMHRLTNVRVYDRAHYVEELGDAWAFFMEICILSGITPTEFFEEYCRKNNIVVKRLQDGY